MIRPDWHREYFAEPYGEVYERYLIRPETTRQEADFVRRALDVEPRARILDCPCGFGRHMMELAETHPNVTGIDADADCLRRARAESRGLELVRADMRQLPFFDEAFDGLINLFNSFGYFSEDENRDVLREFRRVLRSGARLVLDLANPGPLIDIVREHPRTRVQIRDMMLTEEWRYDPETRRLSNHTLFDLAGEQSRRSYSLRLHSLEEISDMLEAAGMQVLRVYGDFNGEEYRRGDSVRCIVAAERRPTPPRGRNPL